MTTITSVYETTGQNPLQVVTLNGEVISFPGSTVSPMHQLVDKEIVTLTNTEFLVLKEEIKANLSSLGSSFTVLEDNKLLTSIVALADIETAPGTFTLTFLNGVQI